MNIAFLGLGAMGTRMAANLIDAGHTLWVWNRTGSRAQPLVARGAVLCSSPHEAATQADVVMAMLRDDDASRNVWLNERTGAIHGLRHGTVAIECSTLSLRWCRDLALRIGSIGVEFLDAPVVGSRPQADAHQLIHLVGGDPEALEQVHSVLEVSAGAIHHVGGCGSGTAMKLAVNALFGIQVAALGELLGFISACGIDLQSAIVLLGHLPVTSPAAKAAAAAILSGTYAPLFPISLVEKDFGYAVTTAESLGAEVPATAFVRSLYSRAISSGYGDENIHAIAKLFTPFDGYTQENIDEHDEI